MSDLATWGAYTTIPFVLTYFVWRRRDIPFTRLFWLFAIFILACGCVHLAEAIIFWIPIHRVSGLLKLTTAIVSWMTVVALVHVGDIRSNRDAKSSCGQCLLQDVWEMLRRSFVNHDH